MAEAVCFIDLSGDPGHPTEACNGTRVGGEEGLRVPLVAQTSDDRAPTFVSNVCPQVMLGCVGDAFHVKPGTCGRDAHFPLTGVGLLGEG